MLFSAAVFCLVIGLAASSVWDDFRDGYLPPEYEDELSDYESFEN